MKKVTILPGDYVHARGPGLAFGFLAKCWAYNMHPSRHDLASSPYLLWYSQTFELESPDAEDDAEDAL